MPGGPWPESFLEMMAVERGAARHTLDAYQRDLADYARFLHERGAQRWRPPTPRRCAPI